jgi:hypothetical protein
MNDPEMRICPFCAEAIKVKARICPRCHQWLTLKSFRHPLVSLLVHVVPMAAIWITFGALIFSSLERWQNPKPYYSEFPNSLKILESRMNWTQTPNGLCIYITGVLTNVSPVVWKDAEFDCRFFDNKGMMIDAATKSGHLDVLPFDDSAFRVAVIPTAQTNEYASFKIFVSNARNTKSLF